jgi:hypothetical protein
MPESTEAGALAVGFADHIVVVARAGNGLGRGFGLDLSGRGAWGVVNDNGRDTDGWWYADLAVDEICSNGGQTVAAHDSIVHATAPNNLLALALKRADAPKAEDIGLRWGEITGPGQDERRLPPERLDQEQAAP